MDTLEATSHGISEVLRCDGREGGWAGSSSVITAAFTEDLKPDFSNLHLMWSAYVQVTGPGPKDCACY